MKKPRVGDMVYYYQSNPRLPGEEEPKAAIVTKVPSNLECSSDGPWVCLRVFTPNGTMSGLYPFSDQPKPGYWTWMPKD